MIGPRCLAPGGSAAKSSAARSLFAADTAPLAECSYRLWQPPQLRHGPPTRRTTSALSHRSSRFFSSAADTKRAHTSSPHVSVSIDQHGIGSVLHDPPFTHAKVKRLRPVSASTSTSTSNHDAPASQPQQHLDHRIGAEVESVSYSHNDLKFTSRSTDTNWPSTRPPDSTYSTRTPTKHTPPRSQSTISTTLLHDFLTASTAEHFQRIKAQLPPDFYRIDAYLLLRERDPQSLASLSYFDIFSLIRKAGHNGYGGVLFLLLQDVIGSDMSNPKAKPGYFQIFAGTEERYKLLREVLVRCNSNEFLLHDGAALNVFMLMLDDLMQVRQPSTDSMSEDDSDTPPSDLVSSFAQGDTISLPSNFPVGEIRRLVKLAVHLHSPELVPILNAFRSHLEAHTPDFPTAREGAQLIAYYLQPNLRDFTAALDVVRALRDTNALPQEVVEEAVRDAKAYLASLEAAFSSANDDFQNRPSDAELQQICMDVSLRLIVMKGMIAQRAQGGVQYRKAFESLIASFRLDLLDAEDIRKSHGLRYVLEVPMRSTLNVFAHLVGQKDKSCLFEALFVLQRSDPRLLAMLPKQDLQDFCDAARAADAAHLAAEAYTLFIKAKTSAASTLSMPPDCKHMLARDGVVVDPDTFLVLLQVLLARDQKAVVIALLRSLRLLPLTDSSVGQLNLRFDTPQRAHLVAILAEAGLVEEAFELFQHWSHWRFEAESNDPVPHAPTLRSPGSVRIPDPLIERQIRLMHDTDRQFATSPKLLISLVRNICRGPSTRRSSRSSEPTQTPTKLVSGQESRVFQPSSQQLARAKFVIDVFKEACTSIDWTHYRLTAFAKACFMAQDVAGAFDALAKITLLRQMPDQVDIAVLLGGLVEVDADKAVDLFIQHCSVPHTLGTEKAARQRAKGNGQVATDLKKLPTLAPMKPSPVLTSMLITRAFAQDRIDLVDKLFKFSQAVGIASFLGHEASMRAVFSRGASPTEITRTVHLLLQSGWTADPALLEKLAQSVLQKCLQGVQASTSGNAADNTKADAQKATPKRTSPKLRLQLVQAASDLMRISAQTKDVVNLRSIDRALSAISRESTSFDRQAAVPTSNVTGTASTKPSRGVTLKRKDERNLRWIACMDSLVQLLRWTKFFDTGDDYRLNLPLWRASNAGKGGFVPAELDEMMDQGFTDSLRQQARLRTSAAAAATLPTASETGGDTTIDSSDSPKVAPTDGVVQQLVQRQPNVLPPDLFCRLIETYLALGDVSGAAEVASWMRDEAKVDLRRNGTEADDFVSRIKAAVQHREAKHTPAVLKATLDDTVVSSNEAEGSSILRMLAGQQSTAHTKRWWLP